MEIFESFIRDVFIPEIQKRRRTFQLEGKRALLLVDGHSSRANPDLLKICRDADIDVMTLVAHASHMMQPLDRGVFLSFKTHLTGKSSYKAQKNLKKWRKELLLHAIVAMRTATTPFTVRRAFELSVIFPIDSSKCLNASFFPNLGNLPNLPTIPAKRPRAGFKISGRVLTSEAVIEELEQLKANKSQKKACPSS